MSSSLSLGNWFLGSRNAGNSVSEWSIFKIPCGACPQIPLGSSHLRPYKASCGASKISRPVLSGVCPLLLKTVENPVGRSRKWLFDRQPFHRRHSKSAEVHNITHTRIHCQLQFSNFTKLEILLLTMGERGYSFIKMMEIFIRKLW